MNLPEFAAAYCNLATQLRTDGIVVQWFDMGVSAEEAARWANLGYLPSEARREIEAGGTIDSVEQSERNAAAVGGQRFGAGIWRNGRRIA